MDCSSLKQARTLREKLRPFQFIVARPPPEVLKISAYTCVRLEQLPPLFLPRPVHLSAVTFVHKQETVSQYLALYTVKDVPSTPFDVTIRAALLAAKEQIQELRHMRAP